MCLPWNHYCFFTTPCSCTLVRNASVPASISGYHRLLAHIFDAIESRIVPQLLSTGSVPIPRIARAYRVHNHNKHMASMTKYNVHAADEQVHIQGRKAHSNDTNRLESVRLSSAVVLYKHRNSTTNGCCIQNAGRLNSCMCRAHQRSQMLRGLSHSEVKNGGACAGAGCGSRKMPRGHGFKASSFASCSVCVKSIAIAGVQRSSTQ